MISSLIGHPSLTLAVPVAWPYSIRLGPRNKVDLVAKKFSQGGEMIGSLVTTSCRVCFRCPFW